MYSSIKRSRCYRKKIAVITTNNINDFDVSKLDKRIKNLIVFDNCDSDKDQVIQNKFFEVEDMLNVLVYILHIVFMNLVYNQYMQISVFLFFSNNPEKF